MGNVALTPQQAYAFARGESVVASNGMTARLNRPLDFLVVSDHAEYLGVLSALEKRDADAQRFPAARRWMAQLHGDAAERLAVIGEIGLKFPLVFWKRRKGMPSGACVRLLGNGSMHTPRPPTSQVFFLPLPALNGRPCPTATTSTAW